MFTYQLYKAHGVRKNVYLICNVKNIIEMRNFNQKNYLTMVKIVKPGIYFGDI